VIAREAGVANGSLFTYFETEADLFNELYLEPEAGMASAALEGCHPARSFAQQRRPDGSPAAGTPAATGTAAPARKTPGVG
jgi:AcrR family transcriptional regulator